MRRGLEWSKRALVVAQVVTRSILPAATLVGCADLTVVRVADGRVIPGRFIGVEGYGAFLLGALADEQGDLPKALGAYLAVASVDPSAPEIWARVARTRCRLDPQDSRAGAAIDRAFHLDSTYEPAIIARAFCEARRAEPRDAKAATDDLARAERLDPRAVDSDVALELRLPSGLPDESAATGAQRLEALTLLHGDRVAAWQALADWGLAHGDASLAVRGLIGVTKRAAGRRFVIARSAVTLAGGGYLGPARQLAGALFDVEGDRTSGGEGPAPAAIALVARLALDEATLRRDVPRLYARSARAHLGVEVAAGRAWAMGSAALARDLVTPTAKADPSNLAARIVLEGASGRGGTRLIPSFDRAIHDAAGSVPLDVVIPFARDVLVAEGASAARRVLALASGSKLPSDDALLTPLLVELAIGGVISESDLPPDGRIELAARRFVVPQEQDVNDPLVDARHKLLGLSLRVPADPATLREAQRLAAAAAGDPLVAVAVARVALARGEVVSNDARAQLEAFGLVDPIAAALVVDLAKGSALPAIVKRARRQLAALAKTSAERSKSVE
jgi:hypothetical protein